MKRRPCITSRTTTLGAEFPCRFYIIRKTQVVGLELFSSAVMGTEVDGTIVRRSLGLAVRAATEAALAHEARHDIRRRCKTAKEMLCRSTHRLVLVLTAIDTGATGGRIE